MTKPSVDALFESCWARQRRLAAVLVLASLCVCAESASADDLQYTLSGRVTRVLVNSRTAQSALAHLGVSAGAAVRIDWTVDPNAPFVDDPSTGVRGYVGAIQALAITVGSWTAQGADPNSTNRILITHGPPNDPPDTMEIFRNGIETDNLLSGGDPNGVQLFLRFDSPAGSGNDGVALDQQQPSLFRDRNGTVASVDGEVDFSMVVSNPGPPPTAKCRMSQLAAAAVMCKATFGCLAKNAKNPASDPQGVKLAACRLRAEGSFEASFDKAAATAARKGLACGTSETSAQFVTHFDTGVDDVLAVAATINPPAPALLASWYTAAGAMCSVAAKAEAKNISKPSPTSLDQARATARAKLTAAANKAIAKAESKGVTFDPAPDVAAFVAKIDALIDDLVSEVDGP